QTDDGESPPAGFLAECEEQPDQYEQQHAWGPMERSGTESAGCANEHGASEQRPGQEQCDRPPARSDLRSAAPFPEPGSERSPLRYERRRDDRGEADEPLSRSG